MLKTTMLRKLIGFVKYFGRPKNRIILLPLAVILLVTWSSCWWLVEITSRALEPPPPPDQDLHHFRRSRSLEDYLDNIQLLVEPSSTPCSGADEVPIVIMVTSSPSHRLQREVIRRTYAKHQPTYFLLGQAATDPEDWLADNYIEAKQHRDMVVYELVEHYQNLTLKSALLMQWTLSRCPHARFMMKTDDDVLINPWTLRTVLKENADAKLLGYKFTNIYPHRDEYNKWYLPRWLFPLEPIPEYLAGPAYIISGEHLGDIFLKAHQVPLINIEDVYFTWLVSSMSLGLALRHERRVSTYKPWLGLACAYWALATAHSLDPDEMLAAWLKIEAVARTNHMEVCGFYTRYLDSDLMLY